MRSEIAEDFPDDPEPGVRYVVPAQMPCPNCGGPTVYGTCTLCEGEPCSGSRER